MFGIYSNVHARVMMHLTCWCPKVAVSIRHIPHYSKLSCRSTLLVLASATCCASRTAATALRAPAQAAEALLELPGARASLSFTVSARIPKADMAHSEPTLPITPLPPATLAAFGPPCSWSCFTEDPWMEEVPVQQ